LLAKLIRNISDVDWGFGTQAGKQLLKIFVFSLEWR